MSVCMRVSHSVVSNSLRPHGLWPTSLLPSWDSPGKSTGMGCHSLLQWTTFCGPTTNAEEAEAEWFYEDIQDLLKVTPKKDVLFIIGDWNAKVGSQEIPGVTGKFGLGAQNETASAK